MANERTYPLLPCRDLDLSIAFYESLGFKRTYRQVRPNPYAVVVLRGRVRSRQGARGRVRPIPLRRQANPCCCSS